MNLELRVNSFITGTNSNNTYSLPTLWEVEEDDKKNRNMPEHRQERNRLFSVCQD